MITLDLGGAWQVAQAGTNKWAAAHVPGCVHTDLLAAGRIPDPFYRDNELALQWIGQADWVYRRTFDVPTEVLASRCVLLRCKGLDTLATIRINGRRVARTDNMYRTWEFDVKRFLRPGANDIEIRFESPLPYMAKRTKDRPLFGWNRYYGITGQSYIRKEPCNFGWDWGPVLVTCGIWRDVEIVAFDYGIVRDVHVTQQHSGGRVTLNVDSEVQAGAPSRLTAAVTVTLKGNEVAKAVVPVRAGKARASLAIPRPQLWWPAGMGEQPLYEVTVDLIDADGGLLDTASHRVGLRTLGLDRHKDKWGQSFGFIVNGVPFFAKGANWIPADAFATRVSRAQYEYLLQCAADANMNMIRVWGGGIYEEDAFYDLCDELGLCVWQDFMFACTIYPTFDQAFLNNVAAEVHDNVRRLRNHACIALWCGNNELEQGLVGPKPEKQMSWADYGILFDKLLPKLMRKLDPGRDYWPGSPHKPYGDRQRHQNPECGDAHLWGVWHGGEPFEWFRQCLHRFCSEFGFQSFPEPATVRGYTQPADRNITSFVMEHHQRSGIGNTTIMRYMLEWFRLPNGFEQTLWLSQILQGIGIKYGVEHWRRNMPRCMGATYWQLNDCWPVASWASIDYRGQWKALHYMARNFYAPLLVSGVENYAKTSVDVHVTNDLRTSAKGTVAWTLTNVAGKVLEEGSFDLVVPAGKSVKARKLDIAKHVATHGQRGLMLWLTLTKGGAAVSSNLVLLSRPKHMELLDPQIRFTARKARDGAFVVTLTCKRPALWAWLEVDVAAQMSDNFFHLRNGQPMEITVAPVDEMTLEQFTRRLKVRSLFDTYE